jgi:hypothetical protein
LSADPYFTVFSSLYSCVVLIILPIHPAMINTFTFNSIYPTKGMLFVSLEVISVWDYSVFGPCPPPDILRRERFGK